ncbi:structural maintenance of chromosomes protein 2 isoform X5 [Pieris brassicae]|uniref:structural maintenance of chromosomes protein 2 isoform X5 n=1 Tax=Pieris brassicae TaxID=7116 RepID=UPI001E65F0C8|nr:structural maintenance of chromosomes protein 2 isoform X5 [Pieris brassicae]
MYIKSIVLDGFKSYGNRVEVTGFDPEFNAITGLNGTGKSNILDSICFVLGITNLSNVRAGSLQELIYKHGQAGITKATVSITFDNKNKQQSPIGYENHDEITVTRQVVMGGKNKYLINGINVQNKRVTDLFCSVQLNVNNPHFLIMQGRITKVLNMKPPEILSMVEEAAGTRMYETKKQGAQKTIEKKDAKLRELNDIIREDIAPKLQKLQDERSQFQEYQKVVRELENLTRLHVAWQYVTAEENVVEANNKVTEVKNDIKQKQDNIEGNIARATEVDQEVAKLNQKLDEESGSVLKDLETELQAAEKSDASMAAAHRAAKEAVTASEAKAKLLRRALADDKTALADKRAVLTQASSTFDNLRSASEAQTQALAEAQAQFLAVSTGQEDAGESLQNQLMAAKQQASEASTRISQSMMEKSHAEERLTGLEREFSSSSSQHRRDLETIAEQQAVVDRLQSQLSEMSFNEAQCTETKERLRTLQRSTRGARDRADDLAARLQRCNFRYTPPQPNFDSNRVAGTVCRLIDVVHDKYCTALETAAGGRLYNVVVDTEVTSKLLLQRGQLQTRTTIIPLNKISSARLPAETVRIAQEIGGGADKVQLALDLVKFPERVRAAMQWVFGGTLVCADLETAKRVTFHPRVRTRCVTLDGDVFDPAGTLSGGARAKGGSILVMLSELKQLEQQLQHLESEQTQCSDNLAGMQAAADKYAALQQKLEMSRHSLEVAKSRVAATAHAQLHDEIESLREQVKELSAALERDKKEQNEAAAQAKELEAKVKDIKGHREREYKKAEQALKKAKQEAERHNSLWKQREQEFETLRLEIQELENAVNTAEAQLKETTDNTADLAQALKSLEKEHTWIPSERQYFGLAGGVYDWGGRAPAETAACLTQLRERKDRLARGLNTRAHTLLGSEEQQYQEVLRKKQVVEQDRKKLVEVMGELDEKKRRTLVAACDQVNRDFASIFSTLLPGAQAQLRPPPGQGVLDGLEVRVGFNGTWKESLSELSGGQRSLVALSLVLAMLLFKPAPLYILDEVDAALDLSHTQNIGIMLKEHFRHSQFVIVSLKDGMFNNANVLFRTRFVDGMSAVQRTVNQRR